MRRKLKYLDEIQKWDGKEEVEGLAEEERITRKLANTEFDKILNMKEVMWR